MRRKSVASVFVLCFAVCLAGCVPGSKSSATRVFDPLVDTWPHDISDIPEDRDVQYGRLENGMRYALQSNMRPEGEAVVRFHIRAGSQHETDDTLGVAHFLEHMAFNGSQNVPEGEMVKSLERLGLSFGADTNASTTFSQTQYMLNLPDVGDETVDYALFLMRETADKLLIDEAAVNRERGVVKAEEAKGNSPGRKARRAFMDFMYPDILSRTRPVIGLPETLDTITAEQISTFYKTHYRPDRALLVIVGDMDVALMKEKVTATFSDWSNETPAPVDPDLGSVNSRKMAAKIYHDDELTTQVSLLDARASTYKGDTTAAQRETFIRGYANEIVNQRIRKQLLDSGAKVRGANISYSAGKTGDTLSAFAAAKDDDWKAGLELLDIEIRRALNYGFQQAEYNELLANTRRRLTDAANYAAKRPSASLASGIVGSFAQGYVWTTPEKQLEYFKNHAGSIGIEDLNTAFKEMWSDFNPTFWLEGPKVDGTTEDDVLKTYKQAKLRVPERPSDRKKLTFAYQDFGSPGKVISETRIDDFDIEQIIFSNNVRLNLKKTDFEDKWINMRVSVGEGWNAFPKDKPAVLTLANAFPLGGYEAHKASELSEIFAGKNIGVNMGIGSERLLFVGSTNPEDVEDQLKAWTALLTAPGYRPEWKEKFIESLKASFHTIDSTPGGIAARDLGRIWTNGDRRFGYVDQSEYEAASIEDVKSVLAPILRDGAIEIGVVGDFDKDAIIDIVAKTYGALPPRRAFFDPLSEAFNLDFPEPDRVTLTHTGAENQGAIYLAWPISQVWSVERSRRYSLLQYIFQNRMTEIIREDMGITYSPSAALRFDRNNVDYGYVSASMTSDPQYFEAFENAAKDIAANLRSGGITSDELERARKPLIQSFERSEKENSNWIRLVAQSQTEPETLDWRRSRRGAFEAMTTADLDQAAKELFAPETLHVVLIKPEDR